MGLAGARGAAVTPQAPDRPRAEGGARGRARGAGGSVLPTGRGGPLRVRAPDQH